MTRTIATILAILCLGVAGCGRPQWADCTLRCGPRGACPGGATCHGGWCASNPETTCASAGDAAAMETAAEAGSEDVGGPATDAPATPEDAALNDGPGPDATVVSTGRPLPPPGTGHCDDVAAQFSLLNNPEMPWSYGYDDGGGFTLFDLTGANPPLEGWHAGFTIFTFGAVLWNSNDTSVLWNGCCNVPPHTVVLHPGIYPDSIKASTSIVRWTSPKTARYWIGVRFFGLSDPIPTTTDVHVVAAGEEVVTGSLNFDGGGNEISAQMQMTLDADVDVDFRVGLGNRRFDNDATGLEATICPLD